MFLRSRLAALLAIAAGVALVAACARVSVPIPGSPVPQSLQTLAVVLVGAVLGPARAALCLIAYVVVGAVGVPVFDTVEEALQGALRDEQPPVSPNHACRDVIVGRGRSTNGRGIALRPA